MCGFRGRSPFASAPRRIVLRTVAREEQAAVIAFEPGWRAAEMRTNTDQYEPFGLLYPVGVAGGRARRQAGVARIRIGKLINADRPRFGDFLRRGTSNEQRGAAII